MGNTEIDTFVKFFPSDLQHVFALCHHVSPHIPDIPLTPLCSKSIICISVTVLLPVLFFMVQKMVFRKHFLNLLVCGPPFICICLLTKKPHGFSPTVDERGKRIDKHLPSSVYFVSVVHMPFF